MIDAVGNPQSILLLGGTSEIGLATVEAFASDRPMRVVLAGRPSPRLEEAKARLEARGCAVETIPFDARETDADVVAKAFAGGDVDVALVAFGLLGDNEKAWTRRRHRRRVGAGQLHRGRRRGVALGERMSAQGHGAIVAFSSVQASGRGAPTSSTGPRRQGSTRSTRGSRRRCARSGVHVTVVRPGFVHTRMTEGMKPAPLSTTPEAVAAVVVDAVRTRKELVWAPAPLRFVMSALRHVPRPIFRRLPI